MSVVNSILGAVALAFIVAYFSVVFSLISSGQFNAKEAKAEGFKEI